MTKRRKPFPPPIEVTGMTGNFLKHELANLDSSERPLRRFGLLWFGIFTILAGAAFGKNNPLWWRHAGAAMTCLAIGLLKPSLFGLPYRIWMAFAFGLGWLMTRVIVTVAYLLIVTPMGLLVRATGKDVLDERIDTAAPSYWKKHEQHTDRERYQKQF